MKTRLLRSLRFLILALFPLPLVGQTFIQLGTVNQPTGSATSYSCAYPQPNGSGNTLMLAARFGTGATVSVIDSQGNTWLPAIGVSVGLWYATNSKAGANTVTITYSAGQPFQGVCAEYSGTFYLDQVPQVASGTGTVATSPSISTAYSGDLIIGFGTNDTTNGPSITAGSGFTLRAEVNTLLEDMT
ncbi:MAG: hypothetical protein WB994_10130, partial [Candidatus Acidiferrum sp.]